MFPTDTAHTLAADVWRFLDLHASAFQQKRIAVVASTTSAGVSLLGGPDGTSSTNSTPNPLFDSRHADLAWAALTMRLQTFGLACARAAAPFFDGPVGFVCSLGTEPKHTLKASWVPAGCVPVEAWAKPMQPGQLDAALAVLAEGPTGSRLWSLRLPDTPVARVDAVLRAADLPAAAQLHRALFRVSGTSHFNIREAYADRVDPKPLVSQNGGMAIDTLRMALRAAANAVKRWEPNPFTSASLTLEAIPQDKPKPWIVNRPAGWRVAWDVVPEGDGFDSEAGDEARALFLDFGLQMDALPFSWPATPMKAWMTIIPGGDVLVGLELGVPTRGKNNPNGEEMEARSFLRAWEPILSGLETMTPSKHAWCVETSRWCDGLRIGAANRAEALGAAQLLVGPFHREAKVYRLPTLAEHGLLCAPTSFA